jgi:tripartite ATP-independent transporter DctM subunit
MMPILLFVAACLVLLSGYPVAFSLAGTALLFAWIGTLTGSFDAAFLQAMPNRLYGIMTNDTLLAVPLFVFMGVMLERSRVAEQLLQNMGALFGSLRGGLGISVILVGTLLAASTGIVGATVITMGLLALPAMTQQGYNPRISTGVICASGTLGQIIPPSIVLILLGDVLSSSYQQAQLDQGIFSPETLSVGDLFMGAVVPGLLLVLLYIAYLLLVAWWSPNSVPAAPVSAEKMPLGTLLKSLFPPLLLIFLVLGSIISGLATPTEAASVGAVGALSLALLQRQLHWDRLRNVMQETTQITSMVFLILIGAALFSLVFRGFGGDDLVRDFLSDLPGGKTGALILVMVSLFLLGFFIDFIEIIFVIVPIVGPALLMMDINPIWLGIMIAINLQTSFLTPPFGFALFYLRGVMPDSISTRQLYEGILPFILIQLLMLVILALWPSLTTWLPGVIYR